MQVAAILWGRLTRILGWVKTDPTAGRPPATARAALGLKEPLRLLSIIGVDFAVGGRPPGEAARATASRADAGSRSERTAAWDSNRARKAVGDNSPATETIVC